MRQDNLEKLQPTMPYLQARPERDFSATGLFVTKLRNRVNDESVP